MKQIVVLVLTVFLLLSCKNDNGDAGCVSRQLPNYPFDTGTLINTNLSTFIGLDLPGGSAYVPGYGVKGIYLYNTGSSIVAFEASDPAHSPSDCSLMTQNGIELSCQCGDGNKYQLLTGQQMEGSGGHCLRAYRVEVVGKIIRVYNN